MGSLWIVRNKKVKTQVVGHKVVLEADPEMELLDLEYIVVEDLIERGDDGRSSTTIMSNHSGLWADLCTPPWFH